LSLSSAFSCKKKRLLKYRNAGLSGILSVRYRTGNTNDAVSSPVP
jgi:hypothetical protein